MWALCVANALNGDDMLAVQADQRCQAGVYTCVIDLFCGGIILADDDGASTTATLSTAAVKVGVISI
jgi:hypothetical protein